MEGSKNVAKKRLFKPPIANKKDEATKPKENTNVQKIKKNTIHLQDSEASSFEEKILDDQDNFIPPVQLFKELEGKNGDKKLTKVDILNISGKSKKRTYIPKSERKATSGEYTKRVPTKMTRTFCLSGFDSEEYGIVKDIILGLNKGKVEKSHYKPFTHLIQKGDKRTLKTIAAISRLSWILTPKYIYDSVEQNEWLEEIEFESSYYPTKEERTRTLFDLFKEHYFWVLDMEFSNKIPYTMLRGLLLNSGGAIIDRLDSIPGSINLIKILDLEQSEIPEETHTQKTVDNYLININYRWVLDCLEKGDVLKMDDYILK